MVTQADSVVLVANVTSANVMADRMYRLIPRGARLRLAAADATGANGRATLKIAGVTLVDNALINNRAGLPIYPDDIVLDWTSVLGGEILLTFLSTGADTVRWKLDIA